MDAPMWSVRSALRMIPRLEAEESLQAATRTAVGSGTLTKHDSSRIQRQWADISRTAAARVRRPSPGQLADMGIAVEEVPSNG